MNEPSAGTSLPLESQKAATLEQFVTFRVGELFLGIKVGNVQEVLRSQPMTPVPLAPNAVKGLVNLRGHIITAIDLGALINLSTSNVDPRAMSVVVQAEQEVASLLVDSIGDVIEIDDSNYEDVPETIEQGIRTFLKGVVQLDNELLLLLDNIACVRGKVD